MLNAGDWDRAYEDGTHERQWDTPWASAELAGVLAALDPHAGSDALDIGCGTGADAVFMAKLGLTVIGLDLSAVALELAEERCRAAGVDVHWLTGDALKIPVASESVDLATDRGCLHHIPDAERAQYASEVFRVLRPGGIFVVRGMSEAGRHKHPVTPETIRRHFVEPRFTIRHAGSYDMVGRSGCVPATLAIVVRQACS